KSDIDHTIDKWIKNKDQNQNHIQKKPNLGEHKRNMLSDARELLAKK
ncbi:unnamed protein product, partial [Rotaria sp. Silwood1]